jgi:FkbM family methyltransferase
VLRATGRDVPWVVKHLPRSGTMRVRLANGRELKLWSRGDDWVSTQVFWRGLPGFEGEVVPTFTELAARSPVTLDVGAHVGYFALTAALSNPGGRVLAFEPHPVTFKRLERNVSLNGLGNVECLNVAAGHETGEADFFHPRTGLASAAGFNREHLSGVPDVISTRVPRVRLDDVLADRAIEGVGLIKLDTETTEPEVLAGAPQMLERDRPDLVCEVLPGADTGPRLEAILGPLGYRFFELTPGGRVERASIGGNTEPNFLFAVDR